MKNTDIPEETNSDESKPLASIASMESFINCARRGRRGGASSGEVACAKLTRKIAEIGDLMMILDSSNQDGFLELCRFAASPDHRGTILKAIR